MITDCYESGGPVRTRGTAVPEYTESDRLWNPTRAWSMPMTVWATVYLKKTAASLLSRGAVKGE